MTSIEPAADDARRRAFVVVAIAALVRLLFAARLPLFPDEAYYWVWSRHLSPGYFDHPGGIALLIRFGTAVLTPFGGGATALAVRLGPVLAGFVAALATVGVASHIAGSRAALRAAVIISVMPLAAAGLLLATPDSPVLAAIAVTLYCVVRALEQPPRSGASLRWWAATGVALGVAFFSKYTSIFLPIGVVLAIVLRSDLRARLREPGPYVACAVATLVFLPVLVWNSHHDWISFVFQLRHGLAAPQGSALVAAWKHEGDLLGGQAGLASPILFVMLVIAVVFGLRRGATAAQFVLAVVTTVSFGFFIYSAIRQRVEVNWPAPAYVPAIALLATIDWQPGGARWLRAGLWLAAAMSALIYLQGLVPILPIPPRKDPVARAFGWAGVARAADSSARALSSETRSMAWLGADRYQEAAELAFYNTNYSTTFATNLSGRVNQYDLWPKFPDVAHAGDDLVLVLDDGNDTPAPIAKLTPYFDRAARGALITMRRGVGEIGTRRVWTLERWRGGWPAAR